MIDVIPPTFDGRGAQLRLQPPRALTARQFVALFVALAAAMSVVAGLGWLFGNAFAPAFVLLYSAIVGLALRRSWRQGERGEVIAIGPAAVEVRRMAESGAVFHAHPYWVRLNIGGDGEWIELSSSGRRCRVGAFLGPAERRQLARRLRELLAAFGGPRG